MELQESAASLISSEEQPLRQQALALQSSIKRTRALIDSLLQQKILARRAAEKLDEDLHRGIWQRWLGRLLKMFLGPIDVRATRKEEYNSYKDRTALLFLLFPATLLVLTSWLWHGCMPAFPVQLYQVDISSLLFHDRGACKFDLED